VAAIPLDLLWVKRSGERPQQAQPRKENVSGLDLMEAAICGVTRRVL